MGDRKVRRKGEEMTHNRLLGGQLRRLAISGTMLTLACNTSLGEAKSKSVKASAQASMVAATVNGSKITRGDVYNELLLHPLKKPVDPASRSCDI